MGATRPSLSGEIMIGGAVGRRAHHHRSWRW